MSANDKQVGGSHYKTNIEPWDAILDWGLGYLDGSAVKYLSRWHKKGGIQDLEKARHYLDKLIEVEHERLQRASDRNVQVETQVQDSNAKSENKHSASGCIDVAFRERVIVALRDRAKEGYGQPTSIGEIT
jgi:hypothetical protein